MPRLTEDRSLHNPNPESSRHRARHRGAAHVLLVVATLAATMLLSACSGKSSSGTQQPGAQLQGNWQFTMAPQTDGNPNDPTFSGGLLGGFLLESNGSITGQVVYSVTSSTTTPLTGACNGGAAPGNGGVNR